MRRKLSSSGMGLHGLKVWIYVLGCRSNLYESEAIAGELEARGARVSDSLEGCRAVVIVSCSVTAMADKKCRQAVRKAKRALGAHGVVAVCGCWAQQLKAEDAQKLGVDILIGNRLKNALPEILEAAVIKENPTPFVDMRLDLKGVQPWDQLSLERPVLRTRAFLKVQEGCDHFCSYCIIPFLRGRSTSRPLDETLAEVRKVVDAGCREVVLTGIHLGVYGRDANSSLAELTRRLSAVSGLERLRLGSLEPFALDDDLLDALATNPVFCPHLHLPLQSGDDEILARMRRGYTGDDFARVCRKARIKLGEDLHISSDVLVAFPGENDTAFRNTLALMERVELGRVHVFPFSPRRGTLAADFPDRVPSPAASARVEAAMALGANLLQRYASRFVGRTLPVLYGYTPHFVAVQGLEMNRKFEARITECREGELHACPL